MSRPGQPPEIITFYSYKGGTGRTMAVANVAWILASSGLRVLAVDWDLESPGLHRYFHPFLRDKQLASTTGVMDLIRTYASATVWPPDDLPGDWVASYARVLQHAVSLNWPFPHDGTVDLLAAGRQDRSYSQSVSTFDWANFFDRLGGAEFLAALRADMLSHYDYVLIDSRTGLSDSAGICTMVLPDTVVDCFTLSTQSVEGAAAVAHSIRTQRGPDEPVRILPVPMRVEDAEKNKLEAGREYARHLFEPFLADLGVERGEYWGRVEIPYRPFYAYEEILTSFGDQPHQDNSLLAAFERLTAVVTDGRAGPAATVAEHDRRRFLAAFERLRSPIGSAVLICYATVDQMWGEWVAGELADAGLTPRLLAIDPVDYAELEPELRRAHRVIVLLSRDYTQVPHARDLWRLAHEPESGRLRQVVPVRLDAARLPPPFDERPAVELAVLSEDRARAVLRDNLGPSTGPAAVVSPAAGPHLRPRFPAAAPPVCQIPLRNAAFTGRARTLVRLREGLALSPQTLVGLGGVGKTQVALEYVHRFSANYDVVWWISAEDPARARADLFELARALGLAREGTGGSVRPVLDALRRGEPYKRWLLVYDSADAPDELRALIPQGDGHVLVTSRNPGWVSEATDAIDIGTFERGESMEFLGRQLPELDRPDAELLAESLGDLPLALEQAAAWLAATGMGVPEYVELLETEPAQLLDRNQPAGYPLTTTATLQLSLRRLREQMPAAAKALEVCAFFAPEPIPVAWLSHERFLAILTHDDESLRFPMMEGRLVREIVRYALASVDRGRNSIVVHRLVQAIIRGQLTPEEQAQAREQAIEVLAAANPGTADDPGSWPAFAELWPHIRIPGLFPSARLEARQLIVDMVRFRYRRYDFAGSGELARDALAVWSGQFGPADLLTLHLRFHLANALRAQARYAESLAINADILPRLRTAGGPDHPYALMAAGGLAADRRALGDFAGARDLDLDTEARFRDAFGHDHYRSLMAANNLAVSHRMTGDFSAAAQLDQVTYRRRRELLGELHPYTLSSACNYGIDLREIGDLTGSRALLEGTLAAYREVIGLDQTETLRTGRELAITLRRLGDSVAAYEVGLDMLDRYEHVLGAQHADTLLCAITVAVALADVGALEPAQELAESIVDKLRATFEDDHVLVMSARHNLGVIRLREGRPHEAEPLVDAAYRRFVDLFGPEHPSTLTAALNLATVAWARDDQAGARERDEATFAALRATVGNSHPETLAAAVNLSVSRAGSDPVFDDAVAAAVRAFGDRYPLVQPAQPGQRVTTFIDPLTP